MYENLTQSQQQHLKRRVKRRLLVSVNQDSVNPRLVKWHQLTLTNHKSLQTYLKPPVKWHQLISANQRAGLKRAAQWRELGSANWDSVWSCLKRSRMMSIYHNRSGQCSTMSIMSSQMTSTRIGQSENRTPSRMNGSTNRFESRTALLADYLFCRATPSILDNQMAQRYGSRGEEELKEQGPVH